MARAKSTTPAALQLKTCKSKVRRAGEHVACDKQYLGDRCPNKDSHLLTLKTGQCDNGWCEGTKATDWRNNPVPTCKMIQTCPCSCHDQLDKLFAMTGHDRLVVESSGYAPPPRTYWLPSDDPLPGLSDPSGTDTGQPTESPVPVPHTGAQPATFGPTPTGRAAKGELEAWVDEQCRIWIIDKPGVPCTPAFLSEQIAKDQAINPPSVGAISACFERWMKLGYAVIEKKPTRFVKYTDEGVRLGLERMKHNAKQSRRLADAEHRRNLTARRG